MSLSRNEKERLEITRDPYFEDIEWEYCIFGAVQMGEGEGGEKFFRGFRYGFHSFTDHQGGRSHIRRQIKQGEANKKNWRRSIMLRKRNQVKKL